MQVLNRTLLKKYMKKIRVLIIHPMDPFGVKTGGPETFVRNFVKYSPGNFAIELVGVTVDPELRPKGKWQDIQLEGKRVHFLPTLHVQDENIRTRIPLFLRFTFSLFRYKKKITLKDRTLEFHRIEPLMAFRECSNPKLLLIHIDMGDLFNTHMESKWRMFPQAYFFIEKHLIHLANRIFVVEEDVARTYRSKYPGLAQNIIYAPNGVDEEVFYPYSPVAKEEKRIAFLHESGFGEKDKLILFVGRLEPQKDPGLLVQTFYRLHCENEHVRLIIVGNGSQKKCMQYEMEKCGLRNEAIFAGTLSRTEVADLMRISDVFVLTSAFEATPRVVLEAQGCGLPVVSTDVGEVKKIIRTKVSGEIVTKRDPDLIAEKLFQVLKNIEDYSISNCSSRVASQTAAKMLKKIYSAYYDK